MMGKVRMKLRNLTNFRYQLRYYFTQLYLKSGVRIPLYWLKRISRKAIYKICTSFISFEKKSHIYDWLHPIILKIEKMLNMPQRCENCAEKGSCDQCCVSIKNGYRVIPRCNKKKK